MRHSVVTALFGDPTVDPITACRQGRHADPAITLSIYPHARPGADLDPALRVLSDHAAHHAGH